MSLKTCISCLETKGHTGFNKGKAKCRKCSKVFTGQKTYAKMVKSGTVYAAHTQSQSLPQIGVPEHKEPVDEVKQWWAAQDARLDRSEKVYKDYIAAHPTEFKEGDHIIIVDNDTVLHRFDSYEAAMDGGRALAAGKGFYYNEYLHENDVMQIHNTVEGQFRNATNRLAYLNANIKELGKDDEYKIEMLIDTGANGCVVSHQLAVEMKLPSLRATEVSTAGTVGRGYLVDILYQVKDWDYKRNIKTVVVPGGNANLLGMSYLRHCHQEWWGDQKVKLRLLEENEQPDVDMNPGLLQSMEKLSLNLHVEQAEVARLSFRVSELEAHLKMALEENQMLERLLQESSAKLKTHRK